MLKGDHVISESFCLLGPAATVLSCEVEPREINLFLQKTIIKWSLLEY